MKEEKMFRFDYIVVYRLDRISRNVADFTNLIEELTKYKTSFICIKEQFDTSTPMGRAMMNIAIVFAGWPVTWVVCMIGLLIYYFRVHWLDHV